MCSWCHPNFLASPQNSSGTITATAPAFIAVSKDLLPLEARRHDILSRPKKDRHSVSSMRESSAFDLARKTNRRTHDSSPAETGEVIILSARTAEYIRVSPATVRILRQCPITLSSKKRTTDQTAFKCEPQGELMPMFAIMSDMIGRMVVGGIRVVQELNQRSYMGRRS